MERNGISVVGVENSGTRAIAAARSTLPDLVVMDLALSGALGLRLVGALLDAAPGAAVVVLSPFNTLRGAALFAGALELVSLRDLRRLAVCVHHVLAAHPDACECLLGLRDPGNGSPE